MIRLDIFVVVKVQYIICCAAILKRSRHYINHNNTIMNTNMSPINTEVNANMSPVLKKSNTFITGTVALMAILILIGFIFG